MNQWTEIRRKVLVEGASKRSICQNYGLGWETLEKILANPDPPGYSTSVERAKPKLGEFLPVIDEILEADKTAPPKQRHTARRIFERLRDEYGYTGGITQVRDAVAQAERYSKEVFVPLSHPPGHAQYDFGEATVRIAGDETKAALAVITLPYSDTYYVSAYPRECTETFHAGHTSGFEFFGGVPIRISYDNTSIAVKKVVGRERELTPEFLRLESHHLFDHHFCRVGRGNEKGHVENHVGYSRRNLLVPVPSFTSFVELNEYLAACCLADLDRRVRGKPESKAERLEVDRAAMLPLPTEAFESRRVVQASVNSLSLVRFDRNDYSVPTDFAYHDVTCLGGIDTVHIVSGTDVVATHPRDWNKERSPSTRATTWPSWSASREPSTLPGHWKTCFCLGASLFFVADWRPTSSAGTREFIKVLRLMERASLVELTAAVEESLAIGATGADAIACILYARTERPVGLFSLDGRPHLKQVSVESPDLTAYSALTANG